MNFLILSAGRRTKVVEYFKNEFASYGNIIATDCDKYAPAIYFSDKYYIVPRIDEANYLDVILDICKKEQISGVLSLIDPELELLAENEDKFSEIGVTLIGSSYDVSRTCFDKYEMYKFLRDNGYNCAKTYTNISDFEIDLKNGTIDFPVFVKPRCGSASLGINKVCSLDELTFLFGLSDNLIIQQFLDGQEYGADCYIDLKTKKVVSIFVKKKLRMRSGETDKAASFKDEKLFALISEFVEKLGCVGTIDIDIFNINGTWYISEVNPRFGGGYPHAYNCNCNFPKYILNNLLGKENEVCIGNYDSDVIMMKHDTLTIMQQ